ncbi:MAG: 2-amino-4-hydroxy-6-hydroxymethyldihydropteridine diphosphokinase [Bacteroidaceae bacterium]|nr:2-amino-4-hydroxy-6-hydroxymethyldihydropteridine diphosphokinase [Bacteroidaceae bacterium]
MTNELHSQEGSSVPASSLSTPLEVLSPSLGGGPSSILGTAPSSIAGAATDLSGNTSEHVLYLSLGSNLGDRHSLLLQAIDHLAHRVGRLLRASSIIQTEPWGFSSPNPFLNAVVLMHTSLAPMEVLTETQAIERELGRTAKSTSHGYADRPIDIDILLYDDLEISTPELTIPHPRMNERDFVLRPLREIQSSLTSSHPLPTSY